jgi:DNA invertase Pin-like site-specific DNA recombinase
VIGVLAELERSLISERTRAGAKAAQQITHARGLIDGGQRREDVAALLSVDYTTLYRALVTTRAGI